MQQMFTSILSFTVSNILPVDELIGSSVLLFTAPDSLPVDELLASTVALAVTASEFFSFYLIAMVFLKCYAF